MRRTLIGHLALRGTADDRSHDDDSRTTTFPSQTDGRLLDGAEHGLRIFHIIFSPIETICFLSFCPIASRVKASRTDRKGPDRTH
jgi:hypothetical protein